MFRFSAVILYAMLTLSGAYPSLRHPFELDKQSDECPCEPLQRPDRFNKEELARWMVHSMDWGVLTTISTRLPNGQPFGNVYSFVDGPCGKGMGIPYFYGTYMDQSFHDSKQNDKVSFTLTEASLPSVCHAGASKDCSISHANAGDPESPVCARLTLSGRLVEVNPDSEEYTLAQAAFFQRHPQMVTWPSEHNWIIAKLEIEDLWLINFYGGAAILSIEEYFSAKLSPDMQLERL
jgi:hypothetical protein